MPRKRSPRKYGRRSFLDNDSFDDMTDSDEEAFNAAEVERLKQKARDDGAARKLQAMWRRKLGRRRLLAMCRATISEMIDPYTGEAYFYNSATQEATWEPPTLLAEAQAEGAMQSKRDAERDAQPEWQAALALQRMWRTRQAKIRLFKMLASNVRHKYDPQSGSYYYQIGTFTTWEKPRLLRYAEQQRGGGGGAGAAKESAVGGGSSASAKIGAVQSVVEKRAFQMLDAKEKGFVDVGDRAAREALELLWGPERGAAIVAAQTHLVRVSVRQATEGSGERAVIVRPGLDFGRSARTPLAGEDGAAVRPRLRRDAPHFDAATDFTEVCAFAAFALPFDGGGTTPIRTEDCVEKRMSRVKAEYGTTPPIPRSESLKTRYRPGLTLHAWPDGSFLPMFPGIEQYHVLQTTRPQRFRVVSGSTADMRARGVGGAAARFGDVGWKALFSFFAYPLVRLRCFEKAGPLRALVQVDAGEWGAQPVEVAREDGTSLDPAAVGGAKRRREQGFAAFEPEQLAQEQFYAASMCTFYAFANAGVPGTVHMRVAEEHNLGCHRSVVEFDGDTFGGETKKTARVQRGGPALPTSPKRSSPTAVASRGGGGGAESSAEQKFRSTNRRRGKSVYVWTVPVVGTTKIFLHAVGGDGAKGQIPTRCRFSTARPVKPWRTRAVFYAFMASPEEEPCFEPNSHLMSAGSGRR